MSCRRTTDDRDRIYTKGEHIECTCAYGEGTNEESHEIECALAGLHTGSDCPGCVPCEKRHCTVCTRHLDVAEVHSCVACRGQARRDALAILELAVLLPPHALHAGRDAHLVAADDIPGGDALVLMSRGSQGLAEDGYTRVSLPTDPPSWTFGWWEAQIREARGLEPAVWMPTNRRRPARTITQASAFLLGTADVPGQLDWAASSFAAFHVLAGDLDTTRRRLEELLYAGDAAAQGVACFTCGHTLEREYRDPKPCKCGPRPRGGHMPSHQPEDRCCLGCAEAMRWELAHSNCDQGGNAHIEDHYAGWHCPRCKRAYSSGEYGLAVKALADEKTEWARIDDAVRLTGLSRGSIQGWASKKDDNGKPLVRRRKDESGRVTYSLADLRARPRKALLDKQV